MMLKNALQKKSSHITLAYLHLAVFLFGSAGVLGKALGVSAVTLVFGRTAFAAIVLGIFLRMRIQVKNVWSLSLCGLLLALHWLLFFQAILISNVTIGLMGFASFPVFAALLEPLWFKEKFLLRDLCLVIIVIL